MGLPRRIAWGIHTIMEKIGYGIIGAGWVLPSHALGVKRLREQGVELVAVVDLDEERARRAAQQFGAHAWYTDYHDVLARDDVQFVSICLPHHLHKDVGIEALRAGKHVLCEKPLTNTTEEADEMIAAARDAGVHLSVVFQHRYDRCFERLHHAAQNGAFGKILVGQVFHKSTIRANPELRSGWRDTSATSGGGVLMMQAIHYLDTLLWCLGHVESAMAKTDTLARPEEVEDTGAAVLRFTSGAIGALVSTNASETEWLSRIEIHGTRGAAVVENGEFVRWEPASTYVDDVPYTDEPPLTADERRQLRFGTGHVKQLADFVTCVLDGRPPTVTAEDGRHATAVMEAIYASNRTGRLEPVR